MVKIILAVLLVLLIICVMGWRMHCLKQDVYDFSRKLEQCLSDMAAGKDIGGREEAAETLWDKVYTRLHRLQHIWRKKAAENEEEKEQIKGLISDISHQTKTPIANMKLYLEMLREESVDPEKREEFLQKLDGQTQKLDFLLKSMVKMSRLETGIIEIKQKTSPVCDTLGPAVAAIVPKAEQKNIQIYVDCDEKLCVSHDRKWTEEAVFNLLDNAVKYTDKGGTIHIRAARQEFFTCISVKDSGKGIALDRQAEIFGRFYREPEVHDQEGIGVGLYLARKIITMQKGYIEVRSREGEGAQFRVYLPNE